MRLLEAYYQLLKEEKRYQLVIVGVKHNRYHHRLEDMLERLDLRGRVIFTGWIPEREKECIYNEAGLLVFPSLLEGFGLPILESMQCGLPVACSDLPSLAEVAGEAAYLFNPYSVEDITRSLMVCLSDNDLRRRLIARGRAYAAKFNWEDTARQTLEVYRMAVNYPRQAKCVK